jgi:hypothetical protein
LYLWLLERLGMESDKQKKKEELLKQLAEATRQKSQGFK